MKLLHDKEYRLLALVYLVLLVRAWV